MISIEKHVSKMDDNWKTAVKKALLVITCTDLPLILFVPWGLIFAPDALVRMLMAALSISVFLLFFLTGLFKAIIDILEMKDNKRVNSD
ncbi:MAG: hypothetical protein ACFFD4_27865 [Candidatus Odinarchaeota archaeon]